MGRKRKNGEGTVRLRKDGRWEGRVVIGYDENGLPKTKNILAKTKGECVEKLAALKATIEAPTPTKTKPDMPFGEWLDYWYETFSKPNARPNSRRCYEDYIRLYIKPQIGGIPLNKLAPSDFQQFYTWMKKDARTRWCANDTSDGLSDNMLLGCHSLCRRALEKAVDEGLIPRNPISGCKLPSAGYNEMKILSREEMQRVLIQAKEEGYYEVFLLEFATGLRLGELLGLQWDDLNMATGELRISRQVSVANGQMFLSEPKTKNSVRSLILPPSVMKVLKEYKTTVSSRWMFPSPKKEDAPLYPAVVSHRLQLLLERSGCRSVRFHALRHTFATNALEYGMDIKTLSTILGHVSSATTLNVYSHITDEMRRSAAAKIDQGIAKAESQPDTEPKPKERTMTTFRPTTGKRRKWGTGRIEQLKSGGWHGESTITMPDGTKKSRSVHAETEEECEALLARTIGELRAEAAAGRERMAIEKAS